MGVYMVGSNGYSGNFGNANLYFMQKVAGTKEAFSVIITEKNIYKKLGVSRSTVSGWKKLLVEGKYLTLDKMEEMLIKSGATVDSPIVWELK